MMSLWDALRMNMMISYQELVRTFPKSTIARWEKCSEGKIRNRLMIAETFIDACIIMSGARLEMDDWAHKKEVEKVA